MVEFFHELKVFITLKIFYIFNILPSYDQRMLEEAQILCEWSWRTKIANFCHTVAGLTSKWGRILPAVYW